MRGFCGVLSVLRLSEGKCIVVSYVSTASMVLIEVIKTFKTLNHKQTVIE